MKKLLLSLALVLLSVGAANAQLDRFQYGVKFNYGFNSVDELQSVQYDAFTNVLRKGDVGGFGRVNLERWFIQAECYFSINAAWDSVIVQENFLSKMGKSLSTLRSANLSIPLMVGYRLAIVEEGTDFFVFGGAEMYKGLGEKGQNLEGTDLENHAIYSIVLGCGLHVFDFVTCDLRLVGPFNTKDMLFYNKGFQLSVAVNL